MKQVLLVFYLMSRKSVQMILVQLNAIEAIYFFDKKIFKKKTKPYLCIFFCNNNRIRACERVQNSFILSLLCFVTTKTSVSLYRALSRIPAIQGTSCSTHFWKWSTHLGELITSKPICVFLYMLWMLVCIWDDFSSELSIHRQKKMIYDDILYGAKWTFFPHKTK